MAYSGGVWFVVAHLILQHSCASARTCLQATAKCRSSCRPSHSINVCEEGALLPLAVCCSTSSGKELAGWLQWRLGDGSDIGCGDAITDNESSNNGGVQGVWKVHLRPASRNSLYVQALCMPVQWTVGLLMSVDFSAGLLWPAVGRHGHGPAVRDCSIAMWCSLGAGPLDWAFQPQNPYASQEQQQHRVLYSCAHRHHASLVYAAFTHASVQ